MADKKKTLGLDLGIASIGWCLFEDDDDGKPRKIIDAGSFVFDQIENPKSGKTENIERRQKRSMRRQRRRRVKRLDYARILFKEKLEVDFFNDVVDREGISKISLNPFECKIKGLNEKLSKEELAAALYHYLKYRGFKSNRKVDDESDKDSKKLLGAIKETEEKMALMSKKVGHQVYVTEYLVKNQEARHAADSKSAPKIHNSGDDFVLTVKRSMYEEEIRALLKKQKEYGLVDDSFIEDYMSLFNKQRDFSEGPASGPYKMSIEDLIGKCHFDGKERAPKDCISARRFIILSSLNNLRYKDSTGDDYKSLTSEQIKITEEACVKVANMSYSGLFKKIGIDPTYVKGLRLTRKQWKTCLDKFNEAKPGTDFLQFQQNYLFSETKFYKGGDLLSSIMKALPGLSDEKYDDIVDVLIKQKTDRGIEEALKVKGFNSSEIEMVKKQKGAKGVIDLSLDLCRKLVVSMREDYVDEEGNVFRTTYDKAMEVEGYKHSEVLKAEERSEIPAVDEYLETSKQTLTNPVVRHSLVQLRYLINAIIKKYGFFDDCAIELSREMKRNFEDRREIRNSQLENMARNDALRVEMLEKYPSIFKSFSNISKNKDALLKYRLFKDQGGFSPYTNKPISESKLFSDEYEIDHIMPYSRSFDDSFDNKVLVESWCNREKKNRLPYEWLEGNMEPIDQFIAGHRVGFRKMQNLRAVSIPEDFAHKDFSDSSYIARLAREMISYYVLPAGKQCRSVSGSITALLRELWGLDGHTHTFVPGVSRDTDYRAHFVSDYIYQDFACSKDSATFVFKDRGTGIEKTFEIKLKKASGKPLSERDQRHNELLKTFLDEDCQAYVKSRFRTLENKDRTIGQLPMSVNFESANQTHSLWREAALFVLSLVKMEISKDCNGKDRSNHLHHALDAAVIACATPGMIHSLTKKFQNDELDLPDVDENGEVDSHFPYPEFRQEVLTRVYERDINVLLETLNSLDNHKDEPATIRNTHVLIPARRPSKDVKGPISKDTIMGLAFDGVHLTKHISVSELKWDEKKGLSHVIIGQCAGSKPVYDACVKWLKEGKKTPYPMLENGSGYPIKKVKVSNGTFEGRVDLSNNRFADNDTVVRVNVYKKKDGGDSIYMVPVYYWQIWRESAIAKQKKAGKKHRLPEPEYALVSGLDPTYDFVSKKELDAKYKLIGVLPRCSLVELEFKKGGPNLICYTGGVWTVGRFECYSCLGDNYDVFSARGTTSDRPIYALSTIKNIKIRSISVLGWIS